MPTVNFYLKRAEGDPPHSLVYLQMRHNGVKFIYSCRFNIAPENWDRKKQIVRSKSRTEETGQVKLNELLTGLKKECLRAYNTLLASGGIPTNELLKIELNKWMKRSMTQEKEGMTFFKFIDGLIAGTIGEKKNIGTIKVYQTARKHLKEFAKEYPVDFATINLDFYYKYKRYLQERLSPNSVGKEIKNVKTFMNAAVELKYTDNMEFKHKKFKKDKEDTHAVYLTDKELREFYRFDFSDNKRLEQVRDFFLFQSYTGLRSSDANSVKAENIIKEGGEYYIKIINKKTKTPVTIPCNDIVRDIFKRYGRNNNLLPHSISTQKFNVYIKEAAQLAGLTEKGRLITDLAKPLHDCLTSHTGRRNFCTNAYLAGARIFDIMAVSGHKTEKQFMEYIKVSRDESAKSLNAIFKKNQLKIV